jgi:hypothetical protein
MMAMDNNLIPQSIREVIERQLALQEVERQKKEAQALAAQQEYIAKGKVIYEAWLAERMLVVPDEVKPYYVRPLYNQQGDELFKKIKKYSHVKDFSLVFEVPGLAPLVLNAKNIWGTMSACKDDNDEPVWGDWYNAIQRAETLDAVYAMALEEKRAFEKIKARSAEMSARWEAREAEQRELDQAREIERTQKAEQQKSEVERLLDDLKNDRIAMQLVKAFWAIQQEKSFYIEQIGELDSGLQSMEERWSRKASELRRMATEAERRAEEERSRASDLEDDLSKAEKKIKRGW